MSKEYLIRIAFRDKRDGSVRHAVVRPWKNDGDDLGMFIAKYVAERVQTFSEQGFRFVEVEAAYYTGRSMETPF